MTDTTSLTDIAGQQISNAAPHPASYGKATAKKDVLLIVWDGSNNTILIRKGDVLVISYHEYDGSLGLTDSKGVEYCVDKDEREAFEEQWD